MTYNPPSYLKRNGRPLDNIFLDEEQLFYRVEDAIIEDGKIPPATIKFPNTSMNREKYSEPEDVLEGKSGHSVYKMKASQARCTHQTDGGDGRITAYDLKPVHDPVEDNYSHTELRLFKNNENRHVTGRVSSNVKREFRNELLRVLSPL
ncbi:MAG: hypothetical protein J7K01_02595 [Thermovirga sp.]|nr:hypothetical protein [Thermovirga sp.]